MLSKDRAALLTIPCIMITPSTKTLKSGKLVHGRSYRTGEPNLKPSGRLVRRNAIKRKGSQQPIYVPAVYAPDKMDIDPKDEEMSDAEKAPFSRIKSGWMRSIKRVRSYLNLKLKLNSTGRLVRRKTIQRRGLNPQIHAVPDKMDIDMEDEGMADSPC